MDKSLIVHAHLYQPQRDDPLTGLIGEEPGAQPYPDWNERIHAECYLPNAQLGNFGRISYDIAPTLFDWMAQLHPDTVSLILEQEAQAVSQQGHPNAMAHPYHHIILPLATSEDKLTQTIWGLEHYRHHYGREPEGFWLPETAVDMETLGILASQGIGYVILASHQAEGGVDVSQPYLVSTEHGDLAVFFFHKDLSSSLSHDPVAVKDAVKFAGSVKANFSENTRHQIYTVASDGELYGHHQHLAQYFLERLVSGDLLNVAAPANWLSAHGAAARAEIRENTSWSCLPRDWWDGSPHGVNRWSTGCNCTNGDSSWKYHLRNGMNELSVEMSGAYNELVSPFADPQRLLHGYLSVVLGKTDAHRLILEYSDRVLKQEMLSRISLALEAEWNRHRMFTSCGWFFDSFDTLEPKYNLAAAANAAVLMGMASGCENSYAPSLELVMDNKTGLRGSEVFAQKVAKAKEHYQGVFA